MPYYAQISDGRCVAVTQTAGLVDAPDMVEIDDYSTELMGCLYDASTNTFSAPVPELPTVPESVSPFQATAALALAGHLETVEAIMADPTTPVITRLAWQRATEFRRNSPTALALAEALGLTSADLDALFITAKGIVA